MKIKFNSKISNKQFHINRLKEQYNEALKLYQEAEAKYGKKVATYYAAEGFDKAAYQIARLETIKDKNFSVDMTWEIGKAVNRTRGHFRDLDSNEQFIEEWAEDEGISLQEAAITAAAEHVNIPTMNYGYYGTNKQAALSLLDIKHNIFGWGKTAEEKLKQHIEIAKKILQKIRKPLSPISIEEARKRVNKKHAYVTTGKGKPKKAGKAALKKAEKLQRRINKSK